MNMLARRYDTGEAVRLELVHGRVQALEPAHDASEAASLPWVAPGFVDLQVNGYRGCDFTNPALTVDEVAAICEGLSQHGVAGFLATLTTHNNAVFTHSLQVIDQACRARSAVADRLWGVHLEGPYISPIDGPRGAHPREYCRAPNFSEFTQWQQASGGRIKLMTLSPEYDEAPEFIRAAVAAGVLIAIGHTNASSEQITSAVAAGARMSTHLGNGAHPQIRRHPNYIWDQLADDRLSASIIADGHHLPPAVVKCFVRAKTPAKTVLVSDMTGMGGMPPGRYRSSLGDVEVLESGKLVVGGQRDLLAGAALPIEYGVANIMRFAGVSLATAVEMASIQPAALIGVSEHRLAVGTRVVRFHLPTDEISPLRIVEVQ